jgi:sugar phosphate isomerase/epimerase
MPPFQIAIKIRNLRLPLKRALQVAHQLGATAVEIDGREEIRPADLSDSGRRQLRKLLEDLNLRVAAVSFPTRRGYNVAESLDERVAATKNVMRMAYELGSSIVVNQVGRVPADAEAPDWPILLEALTDLGAFGQRVGATLTAETGSESGEDLARLIAALPDGSLGVTFNPGNLIINGFIPLDAVAVLGRSILYVHAKDGVRDQARGRGDEVALGRGVADFPAILGALEDFNYRGALCVARDQAEDPAFEIGQAIKFLQSLS